MSAFEALMWRIEADPRLRSPMTMVDLLDQVPDWERLRAAHDWASRLIPRFRRAFRSRRSVSAPASGSTTPTSTSTTTSSGVAAARAGHPPQCSTWPRPRR